MSKGTKILVSFIFGFLVAVPAISVKIGFITFHWPLLNPATLTAMVDRSAPGPKETCILPMTDSPTSVSTTSRVTPFATTTPTPYEVTFPGFLHCRAAPSFSSEEVFTVRGHQLTILVQNQTRDWLFVAVANERCWIYKDIPYLELTPNQITRVPTIEIILTLPMPDPQP